MRARTIALLALAIPVLAGLLYLCRFGAPTSYLAINAGALAIGTLPILWSPALGIRLRRGMTLVFLAALFVPLATGPEILGIARWLPLGPVQLHVGTLVVPALAVLAARDEDYAPSILATALLAASLQPDMATGLALMLAGVGFYEADRDWKYGVFIIVAFFASMVMAIHGELAALPFVERVLHSLLFEAPLTALGLLVTLLACFFLILHALPADPLTRRALAGTLFGFSLAAILSNYPSILIGHGAAPIIGFGLALGLGCARGDEKFGPATSH
ncbi:hypothetical protein [Erythrobacter mangrovi]|uniref:Uncharacterized protein n=1 Tax=Erythrobacter mangrovi TaxID=2739433 RepID=A0A7D4CDS5_9SPHN|nr:hypothetical protein [Erythrobacter mangrovi]QKG71909.1 hypothetical protein HQR01_11365 [Erythrobacter mangrovi]